MRLFNYFKKRYTSLKNNKSLLIIIALHLILAACHTYMYYFSEIQYHADLRIIGCLIIAFLILFFDRPGMAYGFVLYACAIIYINTFYNFGSIFFLLIAFGAYPKIRWSSVIIYTINVFISFSFQKLPPIATLIQLIYIVLFILITFYIYKVRSPKNLKLKLKEDEKYILNQLRAGKLQKEIEGYSEQSITAKLKSARERNMCDSTTDLLIKYAAELGKEINIAACGKICSENCPKFNNCNKKIKID